MLNFHLANWAGRRAGRFACALALTLLLPLLSACEPQTEHQGLGNGWEPEGSLALSYATQFAVDYYADGYKLLSLADGSRFLVIPEGKPCPEGISADIVPLNQPLDTIYLVATSAMCLFDALDSLDAIRLSGTRADGWYNENARAAMEAGEILYAGKYSEPDYERILSEGCDLSIQSTMSGHIPEVKAQLERLGVPVLVDQSSLEPHPLGRTEWLRLYGALLNQEALADQLFAEQLAYWDAAVSPEKTGKTVAFFSISSSGSAVVRRPGDYVSTMLELAGGDYIFQNLGDPDSKLSTVTMEWESFYATAKEADVIIYNSTITGALSSLEELLALNPLLADFKAVQTGNVWCTTQNLFQETTQLGQLLQEFHAVLTATPEDAPALEFLYPLT